jgi:hypothetical protein
MSPSQVQRASVTAAASDEVPLRSLTAVWALLAAFSGAFIVLAARSLSPPPKRAETAAIAPKGPTKEQVRQRQEHIALTERALELARKERKAAQPAATPVSAAPAPASPVAEKAESSPKAAVAPSSAKASSAAASAPTAKAEAASAAPGPAAPAPAKPAAPSGLEGLKADVSFE